MNGLPTFAIEFARENSTLSFKCIDFLNKVTVVADPSVLSLIDGGEIDMSETGERKIQSFQILRAEFARRSRLNSNFLLIQELA